MNSHDARPAVTIANSFGAYRPLLPGVERGLQGATRLLASFVRGLGLRLGSHDRGPPVQEGAAETARAQKRNRSSGASRGRVRGRRTPGEGGAARVRWTRVARGFAAGGGDGRAKPNHR